MTMSMFLIGQTLKKGATDDEKTDFLKEAHLMRWEEPSVGILFSVSLLVSFNKIINVCNYIYGNMCVCGCGCGCVLVCCSVCVCVCVCVFMLPEVVRWCGVLY